MSYSTRPTSYYQYLVQTGLYQKLTPARSTLCPPTLTQYRPLSLFCLSDNALFVNCYYLLFLSSYQTIQLQTLTSILRYKKIKLWAHRHLRHRFLRKINKFRRGEMTKNNGENGEKRFAFSPSWRKWRKSRWQNSENPRSILFLSGRHQKDFWSQ